MSFIDVLAFEEDKDPNHEMRTDSCISPQLSGEKDIFLGVGNTMVLVRE